MDTGIGREGLDRRSVRVSTPVEARGFGGLCASYSFDLLRGRICSSVAPCLLRMWKRLVICIQCTHGFVLHVRDWGSTD